MIPERRQHPRLTPRSPLFVFLDEAERGLLLDVGGGGLAVANLFPRNLDDVVQVEFDLPDGAAHIQAKAEITWTRESGHLTGARFIELEDASRQQLEDWISTRAETTASLATTLELETPSEATQQALFDAAAESASELPLVPDQETKQEEAKEEPALADTSFISLPLMEEPPPQPAVEPAKPESAIENAGRYPVRLFLAVVLLSWALVFLGYRMGSTGANQQNREVTVAAKTPEAPSQDLRTPAAPVSPSHRGNPMPASAAQWNDPGVVLQVAAMAQEDNAETLAQALQKRNFPAFVFRRNGDRFYKVAVGPYSDANAEATVKVRQDLEKQGLQPILKPWLPE
jgi:septal ring-binding cell division protein DamX